MKIAIIGSGYIGLVSAACFADLGHKVICVDNIEEKINKLKNLEMPFYEPGLKELVHKNINKNLSFTTSTKEAVKSSDLIFIAVGTPQAEDGSTNLSYVQSAAKDIATGINSEKFIIMKSTVPVGTTNSLKEFFNNVKHKVHFISNPEFLREGAAIGEFVNPDRIVIGVNNEESKNMMKELYKPFTKKNIPIVLTDPNSSELVKYTSNSMLATRISFMNEIANFCEKVNANINDVKKGVGLDKRIGSRFLNSGIGYGGSCFPKDVASLVHQSGNETKLTIIAQANEVNKKQKELLFYKVKTHFNGNLKGKTFAIWGLAFKPDTDDMREAPSIVIINKLLEEDAHIKVHDPEAMSNTKEIFKDKITYCNNKYETLQDADALLLLTEWAHYKNPDIEELKVLKDKVIFDGRNIYNRKKLEDNGFIYYGIGR